VIIEKPNSKNSHFERCLMRLEQDVLRMGTLVEESFRLSHQSLFARNLDNIKKINLLDKQIDQYYRQIENDCTMFMTLHSPVAQDVRILSAFMQLVRDLERIGDYAQDLSEMAIQLFSYPPHDCMSEIAEMSTHAQIMLAESLVGLAELDVTSGSRVKSLDDTVDDAYERVYAKLAHQTNIVGVVEPILILVLVIRSLERMADHATNIAQRVSYIITGHRA
jgi:phosphate transport system protein